MRADNDLLPACNELDEACHVFTGIFAAVALTLIAALVIAGLFDLPGVWG